MGMVKIDGTWQKVEGPMRDPFGPLRPERIAHIEATNEYGGYMPSCDEEEWFLKQYDPKKFPITVVTVDMVVFRVNPEDHFAFDVLLIKRGGYPFKDHWALPGGFIDREETAKESAIRELREEAGLRVPIPDRVKAVGVMDAPHRDPRGRAISHVFSMWQAWQDTPAHPYAGDDATEAVWVPTHRVQDYRPLAFDHEDALWMAHKAMM